MSTRYLNNFGTPKKEEQETSGIAHLARAVWVGLAVGGVDFFVVVLSSRFHSVFCPDKHLIFLPRQLSDCCCPASIAFYLYFEVSRIYLADTCRHAHPSSKWMCI